MRRNVLIGQDTSLDDTVGICSWQLISILWLGGCHRSVLGKYLSKIGSASLAFSAADVVWVGMIVHDD